MPSEADSPTRSWLVNALLQPEPGKAYAELLAPGWTDVLRTKHPKEPVYTFWSVLGKSWDGDAGIRIDTCCWAKRCASD